MSSDLVPYRRGLTQPEPTTLANTVTDVHCTHCRRTLRNVSLLEIAWSRPCPLCRTCPSCRDLCLTGDVFHGMEGTR
jgi:hypothetical protein